MALFMFLTFPPLFLARVYFNFRCKIQFDLPVGDAAHLGRPDRRDVLVAGELALEHELHSVL